jgi:hypothetical protein
MHPTTISLQTMTPLHSKLICIPSHSTKTKKMHSGQDVLMSDMPVMDDGAKGGDESPQAPGGTNDGDDTDMDIPAHPIIRLVVKKPREPPPMEAVLCPTEDMMNAAMSFEEKLQLAERVHRLPVRVYMFACNFFKKTVCESECACDRLLCVALLSIIFLFFFHWATGLSSQAHFVFTLFFYCEIHLIFCRLRAPRVRSSQRLSALSRRILPRPSKAHTTTTQMPR